jgi:tetratricopeptide (TPR) repeat protein
VLPAALSSGLVDGSVKSALQWIGSLQSEYLMVFDNADSLHSGELEHFFPPGNTGNILITSRNPDLRCLTLAENSLRVKELDEEDAITLLLKASCLGVFDENLRDSASKIVTELCCLPLAVDQAGALIGAGYSSLSGYCKIYTQHRKKLLSHSLFKGASKYDRSVYGTWELSIGQLKSRTQTAYGDSLAAHNAMLILQIFAFFHFEKISEDIFRGAAEESNKRDLKKEESKGLPLAISLLDHRFLSVNEEGVWDVLLFREATHQLLALSLITKLPSSNFYTVHPLVHSWTRDRMSIQDQTLYCKMAFIILACSISWETTSQDYALRQDLVTHIKANFEYSMQAKCKVSFYDDAYTRLALVFRESGYYHEGLQLELQVLEQRKMILGDEHLDTIWALSNLGSTYYMMGQYKAAEKLGSEVLDKRRKILGDDHPSTIQVMGNLASTFHAMGKYKEAEELKIEILEKRKQTLGEEHPDTIWTMGNVASTYHAMGKYNEAEKLGSKVLQKRKIILGEEHPDTILAMGNLASTLHAKGQYAEAKQLMVEVFQKRKRILGDDHPDTIWTLGGVASTYHAMGKYEEAQKLENEVLEKRKNILGDKHPDTIQAMANLASTLHALGQYKEAEKYKIEVLEKRRRLLGEEHPHTIWTMGSIASTYHMMGKYKEAERLKAEVLEKRKKVLGEEHPHTIRTLGSIASTYLALGQLKQAEKLTIEVLEKNRRILGDEHPDTIRTLRSIASTYQAMGQYEEGEKISSKVLEQKKKHFGDGVPDKMA